MENKRTIVFFLTTLCSIILLVFLGCGKKGLPLPPKIIGDNIAAPFDLKYSSDKKAITLFWKHKIDAQKAAVRPEGFEIFMAKKTFKACEGCPLDFKMISFVSVSSSSMQYTTQLEKGFKYYFRVLAKDDNDMRSEFSKTIQFALK